MLETASRLTQGYKENEFDMWVSHTDIMYLTVFNIVYNIDFDGNYVARRIEDGEVIFTGSCIRAPKRDHNNERGYIHPDLAGRFKVGYRDENGVFVVLWTEDVNGWLLWERPGSWERKASS